MTRQVRENEDGSPRKSVSAKSGLNREILNQSWGQLINMLDYKSKWFNKSMIKVDPHHTSQRCSECGFTHKRNRRSQSEFKCLKCGYELNADHNAAKNIKRLGIRQWKKGSVELKRFGRNHVEDSQSLMKLESSILDGRCLRSNSKETSWS